MKTALSMSLNDIGIISSVFPFVYGIAKLFGGVIADVNSPRLVLSGALMAIAICNALFALGSGNLWYFCLIWGLNGIVSSVGFPACARLLSIWFSQRERGFYWGILNISLNAGGALSPIIVGSAATMLGWRFGMLVPAAMSAVCSILAFVAIRDTPAEAGILLRGTAPASIVTLAVQADSASRSLRARLARAAAAFQRQLVDGVLTVRPTWNLAAAYFCVYIIRQALTSWSVFYLMDAKGVTTLAEAAFRVSGLEIGGLLGSVSSGWLSDKMIQRNPSAGAVGQRVKIAILYVALTAVMLFAFSAIPITTALLPLQWTIFAGLGLALYGPQLYAWDTVMRGESQVLIPVTLKIRTSSDRLTGEFLVSFCFFLIRLCGL
jgi:MFS transporter, OPA family, sugar phosphate sensor protein UhpC